MNAKIIRGSIQKCDHKTAYDNDGNEYKQYWITVDRVDYSAKLPKDIYLETGIEVLLELEQGSNEVVASGYCVKMGYHWGKNWKALRGQVDPLDRHQYMEGMVTEKRKSTDGMTDLSRSTTNQTRISYTILLGEQRFRASKDDGEWLQIGMDIAVVLKENNVVLIMDKTSGKISGDTKPYYIPFALLFVALIATKICLVQTGSTVLPTSVVVVLGIFLLAATVLNVLTLVATNRAKRFLVAKIGKRG